MLHVPSSISQSAFATDLLSLTKSEGVEVLCGVTGWRQKQQNSPRVIDKQHGLVLGTSFDRGFKFPGLGQLIGRVSALPSSLASDMSAVRIKWDWHGVPCVGLYRCYYYSAWL